MSTTETATAPEPRRRTGPLRVKSAGTLGLLLGMAVLAAACSSTSNSDTPANNASSASTTLPTRPMPPGAFGAVAAITGASMEVQNPQTGQVTVSWNSATTFTQTTATSLSSVATGDCVVATGTLPSSNSTSGPVAAMGVTVTQSAATGSCTSPTGTVTGGGGFGGGGFGGGGFRASGGTLPNGGTFPGRGSFPNRANLGNFGSAVGKVTAVSGGDFTVEGTLRAGGLRRSSNSSGSQSTPTTRPTESIQVTTGTTTTYNQISSTGSSSLVVGKCVTARGPADQTGAITATSISIRDAGPNGCAPGFGRFGSAGATASGAPA